MKANYSILLKKILFIFLLTLISFSCIRSDLTNSKPYSFLNSENSDLPGNSIRSIKVDRQKTIWIGTWGGGITTIDSRKNINVLNSRNSNLSSDSIRSIYIDIHNRIFVTNTDGIFEYKNGIFSEVVLPKGCSYVSKFVKTIFIDSKDNLWISSGYFGTGKLIRIDASGCSEFDETNSPISPKIYALSIIEDVINNCFYMATYRGGMFKFDGKTWTAYNTENSNIPYDIVDDLGLDINNNLWISMAAVFSLTKGSCDGSLCKFDGTNFEHIDPSLTKKATNRITAMELIDSEVWVATALDECLDVKHSLSVYSSGVWKTFSPINDSLPDVLIWDMQAKGDSLLLASDKGVVIFDISMFH